MPESAYLDFLEAQTIVFLSLWKTYVGPALGAGFSMSYFEAIGYTLIGASITVFCSVYFRHQLTRLSKVVTQRLFGRAASRKPGFNPRLRKTLVFYRRYGFWGLMLLTPVLIGLPLGTWLALRLGSNPLRVAVTVLGMSLLWSTLAYFFALNGLMFVREG